MKNMLVIDGNSIVNRAYHGIAPLNTSEGIPTNAVYGFLNIIKKQLDRLSPEYKVCAFDVCCPTFRHKEYPDYKAGRNKPDDELISQFPLVKRAAAALGFNVIECPGYEADDILGTSARLGSEKGDTAVYLLTGDRDSFQLIGDNVTVVYPGKNGYTDYTPSVFEAEYGIKVGQFVDMKALMGDSSDNIPGVAGIGPKTAADLLVKFGSLDGIYASDMKTGMTASVAKKLTAGKENAYMSRWISEICREAPVSAEELFRVNEPDAAEFAELCRKLEFSGMADKFGLRKAAVAAAAEEKETALKTVAITSVSALPSCEGVMAVYIDGDVSSFSFDGETAYVCENTDTKELIFTLRDREFVCFDYKTLLRTLGCEKLKCVYDSFLAAYLLSPGEKKYSFDEMSFRFAGISPISYAEKAAAVYRLYEKTAEMLKESGMYSVLTDIELPLAPVLASMENIGFRIDREGLHRYSESLGMQENAVAQAIWMQAGHEFNINSPKQLGEVLFEELGLPAGKKKKSGYSTDAETLEGLVPYHQIVSDILMYRQLSKLRGTYGDSLADMADENDRIHTTFNQTGTATGRLSSSDPNLQNIPVRGELGRELRRYFIPSDGCVLIDADYSQIELRLLAALSGDDCMSEAFLSGLDIHRAVAAQVFGVSEDEVTPELRRRAKAVNFGIVYGIGEFSLAKDLGISRRSAKEYIDNYLTTYSGVDRYLKNTIADAKKCGYTTTGFGRRRNIPELSSSNKNLQAFGERVAMNSPIQGTAADVIKLAMVNVSRALEEADIDAHLIMQVHDELIVEAAEDCAEQAAEILVREMENAAHYAIPLTAECGKGGNWLDAK